MSSIQLFRIQFQGGLEAYICSLLLQWATSSITDNFFARATSNRTYCTYRTYRTYRTLIVRTVYIVRSSQLQNAILRCRCVDIAHSMSQLHNYISVSGSFIPSEISICFINNCCPVPSVGKKLTTYLVSADLGDSMVIGDAHRIVLCRLCMDIGHENLRTDRRFHKL